MNPITGEKNTINVNQKNEQNINVLPKSSSNEVNKTPDVIQLNSPINKIEERMPHVEENHTATGSNTANKSVFYNDVNVRESVKSSTQQQMYLQDHGNYARVFNAPRNIGTTPTGLPTSSATVITKPNGDFVTAYPGQPRSYPRLRP